MSIGSRFRQLRSRVPESVSIVLAAKMRTDEEVAEAIEAGAEDVGHNYVQQLVAMHAALAPRYPHVRWHLIGHLQKNKINKVVPLIHMLQTVDSEKSAQAVGSRVPDPRQEPLPVLLEINSGVEASKSGIAPNAEAVMAVAGAVVAEPRLRLRGLMTMAPYTPEPEEARPYFAKTQQIFEHIRSQYPAENIDTLSMGMSHSYGVAVESGATMVRVGSAVFGER